MARSELDGAIARGVSREVLEKFHDAREWLLYSVKGGLALAYHDKSVLDEALAELADSDDTYGSLTISGELREKVWREMLTALATNGEPYRCFIPRHVLQAGSGTDACYIIFCFECRFVLIPGGNLIRFADSAGLEKTLNRALKAAGIMDSATMHKRETQELAVETERERKAYIDKMNRRFREGK